MDKMFQCFKSFHLSCLSKDDGQFFDDYVILEIGLMNCFYV